MARVLPPSFFERTATVVARDLLGKVLVRRRRGRETRSPITEVEAYHGLSDRASHAHRGLTPRNAPMFGAPGHWYVYFVYGMHWMSNVVTAREGVPSAVLIRAAGDAAGPAILTARLGIDERSNALPASRASGLWIEDGRAPPGTRILRSPRIGVAYAGPVWAAKEWRYRLVSS